MNKPAESRLSLCQVFVEETPQRGTWNMAVDEALLESAADEGVCWLRWYQWSEPTVSLGYFQSGDIPPEFAELPKVRRLSGGGAILHHHELTYSAAVPARHPLVKNPAELYAAIHNEIITVLADFGLSATKRGTQAAFPDESFLCFQRGDANDVVVLSDKILADKILGSAQRRRRGAVLQHGSLLLQRSHFAEELPGVLDLGLKIPTIKLFQESLSAAVASVLGTSRSIECLPEPILQVARRHEENRYKTEQTLT